MSSGEQGLVEITLDRESVVVHKAEDDVQLSFKHTAAYPAHC